jgi:hypothetical protein
MHHTGIRWAVALAALVILAGACGDDSGDPFTSSTTEGQASTTSGGEATTTSGSEATTTAAGETTTSGAETTITGAGSEAGDIEDLLEHFQQVPLRTTYLMGADQEEMTFSQDPTQDPPVSAVLFEGGKFITIGDSTIICSGEGAGSQCFETPAGEGVNMATAALGPFATLALSLQGMTDTPGVEVESEQVTIAGRSGVCFTYRPEAITGSNLEFARQCIDTELGFSLLMEVKEAGSDEVERVMELIAVGQPEPNDFEPTGPVIPLPEG